MDEISVISKEGKVYYHITKDERLYGDLYSIAALHPECAGYIAENKIELQRRFFRMQEIIGDE